MGTACFHTGLRAAADICAGVTHDLIERCYHEAPLASIVFAGWFWPRVSRLRQSALLPGHAGSTSYRVFLAACKRRLHAMRSPALRPCSARESNAGGAVGTAAGHYSTACRVPTLSLRRALRHTCLRTLSRGRSMRSDTTLRHWPMPTIAMRGSNLAADYDVSFSIHDNHNLVYHYHDHHDHFDALLWRRLWRRSSGLWRLRCRVRHGWRLPSHDKG